MPKASAFTFTVEDGITPLLTKIGGAVRPNLQWMVKETATALTAEMRRTAPLGRHYSLGGASLPGGALRRSLRFQVGELGAVLSGLGYGRFVIGGTQPHPIVAVRAKALRFWWARRGVNFIGPAVNHPGNRANDFRLKALDVLFESQVFSRIANQMLGATLDGEVV